jgi:hypothetical protein
VLYVLVKEPERFEIPGRAGFLAGDTPALASKGRSAHTAAMNKIRQFLIAVHGEG